MQRVGWEGPYLSPQRERERERECVSVESWQTNGDPLIRRCSSSNEVGRREKGITILSPPAKIAQIPAGGIPPFKLLIPCTTFGEGTLRVSCYTDIAVLLKSYMLGDLEQDDSSGQNPGRRASTSSVPKRREGITSRTTIQ